MKDVFLAQTSQQWSGFQAVLSNLLVPFLTMLGTWAVVVWRDKRQQVHGSIEVRAVTEFVKRAELVSLTEVVKELQTHRERDLREIEASAKERNTKLYEEVKSVRSDLSEKVEETRKELSEAQDATRGEMEKGFKDLERAIGRIEGKLQA